MALTGDTSLAVDAVRPPALRRPGARTAAVVIDQSGWARQDIRHAVHAVEELVADLRVGVPEVAVSTGTAFAGLRVLWNRKQVRQATAEQVSTAVTLQNCSDGSSRSHGDSLRWAAGPLEQKAS